MYESFESTSTDGIVVMPDTTNESVLGGHALLVVGYPVMTGQLYLIVRNSWGATWGDHGYCYIPMDYLTDTTLASDFWVGLTAGKAVTKTAHKKAA